ncbi:antitoxin MazE-like protein [Acidovorax sp. NCPPB 3576]|uniref:antitoxin MazE-like protein n=1 Tax=Acidovorax sp. NCPPB 3576 TaxID=2940488 RepID=UPI003FA4B075
MPRLNRRHRFDIWRLQRLEKAGLRACAIWLPFVRSSSFAQICKQLCAAVRQKLIPLRRRFYADRRLFWDIDKHRNFASTNQTQYVQYRARTLPVPNHEAKIRHLCHFTVLGGVEMKPFYSLGRHHIVSLPLAEIITRILAGAKYGYFIVVGFQQMFLHRFIGTVGVSNHHLVAVVNDVIQALFNLGGQTGHVA